MARGAAAAPEGPVSKKPIDSDFYQQRLKAWQPILTPKWVIFTFLIIGIPFVIIGFVLKNASDNVVEYSVQYDGEGTSSAVLSACGVTTPTLVNVTKTCTLNITTDKAMKGPVYVYYELDNFYQNHRRYVKSRSDSQLSGKWIEESAASDCDPLRAEGGKFLYPCGLVANSVFNDTFALASPNTLSLNENGIAWSTDREKKFKDIPDQYKTAPYNSSVSYLWQRFPQFSSVTNEHFIVWMRPAALPRFRKLYGKIESDVAEGTTLSFNVGANFPVDAYGGKKSLVVSNLSFIGGKNPFLGIAYIAVGFAALGMALAFAIKQFFGGRKLGDTSYLVYSAGRR